MDKLLHQTSKRRRKENVRCCLCVFVCRKGKVKGSHSFHWTHSWIDNRRMSFDRLFARTTMIVGIVAILGVILGLIGLSTDYWTMENVASPGMPIRNENGSIFINEKFDWTWNVSRMEKCSGHVDDLFQGLFRICTSRDNVPPCIKRFWKTTFILCLTGLICLFIGGILSLWEMFKTSDRRLVIPMLYLLGCVLMTGGLFDYGSWSRLNSHSSRLMISSIVCAYVLLAVSSFLAGRSSIYDRCGNNAHLRNGQKYLPAATNSN